MQKGDKRAVLTIQTNDNFYAQIHLLADANVVLCSGSAASSCTTKQGTAGINRFSGPLVAGQTPSIRVERGGKVSTQVTAPMAFNGSPTRYNYSESCFFSHHKQL